MSRILTAAIVAVLLLAGGAGSASAATLKDILTAAAPIKVITPDMLEANVFKGGRTGFLHRAPDDGILFSAIGPADDIEEVNALISFDEENGIIRLLAVYQVVGVAAESDDAVDWAVQVMKRLGRGKKKVFSKYEVEFLPIGSALWVTVKKNPQ